MLSLFMYRGMTFDIEIERLNRNQNINKGIEVDNNLVSYTVKM